MRSQKGKCPQDITTEINQKTSSWGNALAGMNQMSATRRLQKALPVSPSPYMDQNLWDDPVLGNNQHRKKKKKGAFWNWKWLHAGRLESLVFDSTHGMMVVSYFHFIWVCRGSLCTQGFLTEGPMSAFLCFSCGMVMLLRTSSNQPNAESTCQVYYLCNSSTAYVDLESSAT